MKEDQLPTNHVVNTYLVLTSKGRELARQTVGDIDRRGERIRMSFWQKAQEVVGGEQMEGSEDENEEDEDGDEDEERGEKGTGQQDNREMVYKSSPIKLSKKRKSIEQEREDETREYEEGKDSKGGNDHKMSPDIEIISREQFEADRLSSKKLRCIVISSDSE